MELSMHMLLLTAANLALVARGEEGEDKSFVEVCSSEHGTMAVSPRYEATQLEFSRLSPE